MFQTSRSLWPAKEIASVKIGSVPSEIRTGYPPNTILELFQENNFSDVSELYSSIGFEVLTAVGMNVAIFCDIRPCSPYVNWRFGGTYNLHLQGKNSAEQETRVKPVAGPVNDSVHSGTIVKIKKSRMFCRGQYECWLETPEEHHGAESFLKSRQSLSYSTINRNVILSLRSVAVIAKAYHWSLS
jgi:hypothetical protein